MFDASERALDLIASWIEADALPTKHWHRAALLHMRGVREYFRLDYAKARKYLLEAREVFEALGMTDEVHAVLYDISGTHFYQDHFAEAERCIQFVIDARVNSWAVSRAQHRLSELRALRMDMVGAIAHQRLSVAGDTDREHYLNVGIATLAELLIATGELDEAALESAKAVAMAERMGDRHTRSDTQRTAALLDAARGYYAAARARISPRVSQFMSRGDKWHVTGDLAILALCSAALYEDPDEVDRTVRAFIAAYAFVPHDEPCTWWALRSAQAFLRGRGREGLAAELGSILDARLEHIARAFDDDEPITEDADVRSDAAKRASHQ
jgi:hypothetical protein